MIGDENWLDLGPLSVVAEDESVTDIAVTCDGRVWVDRCRRAQPSAPAPEQPLNPQPPQSAMAQPAISQPPMPQSSPTGAQTDGMVEYRIEPPFHDARSVRDYAVRLCAQLGCRLDDASPIADASTPSGVRIHAVIAPLVPQGAAISIRLPSRSPPTLEQLESDGMIPGRWLPLLRGLVAMRASIMVTGGTGAGKTTLLKALLNACGPNERIVTVEEVRELDGLDAMHQVSLLTREANVENRGAIGLSRLVRATLRMRPDRVVLGECRGEEIVDLLRAFNSGHRGGMVTVHANDVRAVPSRLVALGLLAGLAPAALAMLAGGAFDVVLHVVRRHGRRFLAQIGCLAVRDGELVGVPIAAWDGGSHIVVGPAWAAFARRWGVEDSGVEELG